MAQVVGKTGNQLSTLAAVAASAQKPETVSRFPVKPKENLHPPTSVMVKEAIELGNSRRGTSFQAIKKYIAETYKMDPALISRYVKKYLNKAVESGELVQASGKGATGSFKIPSKTKPSTKVTGENPTKVIVKVPPQPKIQPSDMVKGEKTTRNVKVSKPPQPKTNPVTKADDEQPKTSAVPKPSQVKTRKVLTARLSTGGKVKRPLRSPSKLLKAKLGQTSEPKAKAPKAKAPQASNPNLARAPKPKPAPATKSELAPTAKPELPQAPVPKPRQALQVKLPSMRSPKELPRIVPRPRKPPPKNVVNAEPISSQRTPQTTKALLSKPSKIDPVTSPVTPKSPPKQRQPPTDAADFSESDATEEEQEMESMTESSSEEGSLDTEEQIGNARRLKRYPMRTKEEK